MISKIFKHKDFTIQVNKLSIQIEKDNSMGRVHATFMYDRVLKKGTFSGQFPWVTRDGFIHRKFLEVMEVIDTSLSVTLAKTPKVISILDTIYK